MEKSIYNAPLRMKLLLTLHSTVLKMKMDSHFKNLAVQHGETERQDMSYLPNSEPFAVDIAASSGTDELVEALLNEIPRPVLLIRHTEHTVFVNRRCELMLGYNGRQLSYLYKIGQLVLRHGHSSKKCDYSLSIPNSSFRFCGYGQPAGNTQGWTLLEVSGTDAGEDDPPQLSFDNMIGRSPAFLRTIDECRRAEAPGQPVLLCGESGTGKETLARAMHLEGAFPEENWICIHNNVEFSEYRPLQSVDLSKAIGVLRRHTFYIDEVANFNHYNQDRLFF